jgi:hypothetical protein
MLGDREIARSSVEIKEGEAAALEFAVPFLMDDEKQKVEGLRAAIGAGWDVAKAMADVDAKMAEFASLFGDVSYSPKLSSYKDEAKQLGAEWTLRKGRAAIEGSAWDPKVELLDAGGALYAGAKGYPDPLKIRKAFEESAQLVATLFELKAGKSLGEGDIDSGLECFGNALMLSTRYLGGKRMTDYAYAVTTLKDFQEKTGAASAGASDKDMQTAFGALIQAGRRFYGLQNQVMAGTACALVASDFGTRLSVDGGEYADAPLALQPVQGSRAVSVQSDGAGKAITLTAVDGEKLLFVQDGFASFGKITLGYIPGSIQVEVNQEGAKVALDDEDPVDTPHLFENVVPGVHKLAIHDLRVGDKIYTGVQENISVEAGKRLKFARSLTIGKAKLRVEGIPKESILRLDGEEQPLALARLAQYMVFESTVDAGVSSIEVVHGGTIWYTKAFLTADNSRTFTLSNMALRYSPERRNIKMNKKAEEWAGLDPMFGDGGGGNARGMNMPGSRIVGGTLCRDDKNLYIKMDFSNGKPALNGNKSARGINLRQDSQNISLETSVWLDNGSWTGHAGMWVEKEKHWYPVGSLAAGSTFLEMRFPFSWFSKFFDFSKPINACLYCWIGDPSNVSYTPRIDFTIER